MHILSKRGLALRKSLFVSLVLAWNVALARPFTASDLVTLREIGAVALSPNGRWLVWDQRETDLASNRTRARLWLLDLDQPREPPRLLLPSNHNVHHPRVGADGKWIYFLSDASGVDQLWRAPAAGSTAAEQVSDFDVSIAGYSLSPTGEQVAIWADVSTACNELPCTLPQPVESCCGSGKGFDDAYVQRLDTWRRRQARSTLYVSHRDEWMMPEIRSRVFVMPVNGGNAGSVMGRWLGDAHQAAWSTDASKLFFTLREAGSEERFSLDLDVIEAHLDASTSSNLTGSNPGIDMLPATSSDGRWLAYVSARSTHDAARRTLRLRDLVTGTVTSIADDWDASVRSVAWAADNRSLLVTARFGLDEPLFQISLDRGNVTRLTAEGRVANVIPLAQGGAVFTLDTMQQPADMYRLSADGDLIRLTAINEDRLREIDIPRVERFEFKGAKAARVSAWMIAPEAHRGRLPTLLLIHDGLHAESANAWSRHWNPLLFAAPGYAVVGVDFHRTTGSRIERDRLALKDVSRGLAAAASRFPTADPTRVCIAGNGAYGGFLAYRIAGEWSRQPRCLIANGAVVDATSLSYQTDEPWMHDWLEASTAGRNDHRSPLHLVSAWRTPLLILHGERNFRVPYTQSLAAFTASQRRNVPSRLVVFPDEGVSLQLPKNTIQWYGEVFNWLDRWLVQRD
jgi:dipeptidyl aminopeptidase/acylaminoacyl peptidase